MGINELSSSIGAVSNVIGSITPTTAAIVAGGTGLVIGAGAGAGIMAISHRKKTKKHRRTTSKKNKHRRKKHKNYSKHNKRTSHKKIHYTKNHQPYIILASGKARFIKKSSAGRSKKLKGGRY